MVNKKGYLRILEAMIASVLLLAIVLFINSKTPEIRTDIPLQVLESQRQILEKIYLNNTLRKCIIDFTYVGNCFEHTDNSCKLALNDTVYMDLPLGYDATCEICNTSLSCISSSAPADTSVYTDARFFIDKDTEKIVRIYFWR